MKILYILCVICDFKWDMLNDKLLNEVNKVFFLYVVNGLIILLFKFLKIIGFK